MSAVHSPTVRRRRLASELRRLHEAAKLTCEDVAAALDCSASKISRIETGRVTVSPRDVRDLLGIYRVAGDQSDSLVQLARDSRHMQAAALSRDESRALVASALKDL